jgi:hypothetical protein
MGTSRDTMPSFLRNSVRLWIGVVLFILALAVPSVPLYFNGICSLRVEPPKMRGVRNSLYTISFNYMERRIALSRLRANTRLWDNVQEFPRGGLR